MDFKDFVSSQEFQGLKEEERGDAIREFYNRAALSKAEEFDAVSANRLKDRGEKLALSYDLRSQSAFGARAFRDDYKKLANINDQRIKLERDLESGAVDRFAFLDGQTKLTLQGIDNKKAIFETNADQIEEAARLYIQSGLSGLVDESALKNKDGFKLKFNEVMSQLPEAAQRRVRDDAKIMAGAFPQDFATDSLGNVAVSKPSIWFNSERDIRNRIAATDNLNKVEKERLLSEVSERRSKFATATLDSLSDDISKFLVSRLRFTDPGKEEKALIDGKFRDTLAGDSDVEKFNDLVRQVKEEGKSATFIGGGESTSRSIFDLFIGTAGKAFLDDKEGEVIDKARQEGKEALQRITALQESILGDDAKLFGLVKASSVGAQVPNLLMVAVTGNPLAGAGRSVATGAATRLGLGARSTSIAGRIGTGAGTALPFSLIAGNDAFNEARFSDDPKIRERATEFALKSAITEGVVTTAFGAIGAGGLESINQPIKEIIKGTAKDTFLRNLGRAVTETAKQTGAEILEEEIIQVANSFLVEAEKNPEFTVGQFKDSLLETALTAGLITLTKRTPVDALTTTLDAAAKIRDRGNAQRKELNDRVRQDLIDSGNGELVDQLDQKRGQEIRQAQQKLEEQEALESAEAEAQSDPVRIDEPSLTNEEIDRAIAGIDSDIRTEPDTQIVENLRKERESLVQQRTTQDQNLETQQEPDTTTEESTTVNEFKPANLTEAIGKGISNIVLKPLLKSKKIEAVENAQTPSIKINEAVVSLPGVDKASNQNLETVQSGKPATDESINSVIEQTFGFVPENVKIVTNEELPDTFADVTNEGIRINRDLVTEDNIGLKLDHELGHIAYNQSEEVRNNFNELFETLTEDEQNQILADVSQAYAADLQGEESRIAALESVRKNAQAFRDKPIFKRLLDSIKEFFTNLFGGTSERTRAFDADALAEKIIGLGAAKLIEAQDNQDVTLVDGQRQAKKSKADREVEKVVKKSQKRALKAGDEVKVTQAFGKGNKNLADVVEQQQPIIDQIHKDYPFLDKKPTKKSVEESKQLLVKLATDRSFVNKVKQDTGTPTGVEALVSEIVNHAAEYYRDTNDKSFLDMAFALSANIEITTNIGDAARRLKMRASAASKISLVIGEYQNGINAWVNSDYLPNVKTDTGVKNFGSEAQKIVNESRVDEDAVSTAVGEKVSETNPATPDGSKENTKKQKKTKSEIEKLISKIDSQIKSINKEAKPKTELNKALSDYMAGKISSDQFARIASKYGTDQNVKDLISKADELKALRKEAKKIEASAKKESQSRIEKAIERFARLHTDTPNNAKRQTSELQKLIQEHLRSKDADGNQFNGIPETQFIKRVIDLGFERQAGKRLYDLLQKERGAKRTASNVRITKAISKLNGKKAAEFILENPYLTYENSDRRRQYAEEQLVDKGLSLAEARQYAKLFDQEFSNSLVEARVKAIQKMIGAEKSWNKRITEKRLADIRKAIRLGVADPRYGIAESILAQGGWDGISQSQFDRMVEIDSTLLKENETLTAHEKARLIKELGNILGDVDVPVTVLEMIVPAYVMSMLSGLSTMALQFTAQVNKLVFFATRAISGFEDGWQNGIENIATMSRALIKEIPFEFREMFLSWRDDAFANKQAEELEFTQNKLARGLREGARDVLDSSKKPSERAAAVGKLLLGLNAFVSRTLGAIDQGHQRGWKRFVEITEGARLLRKAGIPKNDIRAIMSKGEASRDKFTDQADSKGYTGIRKKQFVEEMVQASVIQGFAENLARATDDGILKIEQLQEMASIEGQLNIGTHDYEDGLFPTIIQGLDNILKKKPILRFALPILKTPAQMAHRALWYSPVGLFRAMKLGGLTLSTDKFLAKADALNPSGSRVNPFTQTLKYEQQWSVRRAEAILGTVMSGLFAMMFLSEGDEEEGERSFGVYVDPPSNNSDRQRWEENGGKRNSFFFKIPGTDSRIYGRWDRGTLEPLQQMFILIGSIQKSNDYADSSILGSMAKAEGSAFFEAFNSIERNSDFFNAFFGKANASSIPESGRTLSQRLLGTATFGSNAGKALGYKAAPLIPLSGLLRTSNKLADKKSVDTFGDGFLSAVPVFGGLIGEPALNELGDPIRANESSVMEKLGMFAFMADPGSKKDIYKEFSRRKYWPSQSSRRRFDEKYGGLVGQEKFYEFGRLRGKEIEKLFNSRKQRLLKLNDKDFKKEMTSIIKKAGERAASKLKLKPLKK